MKSILLLLKWFLLVLYWFVSLNNIQELANSSYDEAVYGASLWLLLNVYFTALFITKQFKQKQK